MILLIQSSKSYIVQTYSFIPTASNGVLRRINIAKVSPSTLSDSISDHPYLTNIGVLSRTVQLAVLNRNEPESVNLPKLEDEVYLRVCIYGIERQMELKSNFEELHSKYRELTGIVECLR